MGEEQSPPTRFVGGGTGSPVANMEKTLVVHFERSWAVFEDAALHLAVFYSHIGRQDEAMDLLRRLLAINDNPERKADYLLKLGQMMEQKQDYPGAVDYYRQAFSLEPENPDTWYWINNNLGFCLNTLGEHIEGEALCRTAIQIDAERQNAWKNLGIALEGQGRYAAAAQAYITAVHKNLSDPRALRHLEQLVRVLVRIP